MLFHTKRTVIRELTAADFPGFHQLQSDPRVMQYSTGEVLDELGNQKDLQRVINAYTQSENALRVYAVVDKRQGDFLGTCALIREGQQIFEIGIRLLQKIWGRGFGQEVVLGTLCYAFADLAAETCTAYVDRRNIASHKIISPLMQYQGDFFNAEEDCWDHHFAIDLQSFLAGHFSCKLR